MMMPDCRCSPSPGRQLKLGNCDSATFMRKVPEPALNERMRRRKSAGSSDGAIMRSYSSFGPTLPMTVSPITSSPLSSLAPSARPPATITCATGASRLICTPMPCTIFAIACVIAPMPPTAWPQAPFLPFTSPKTWCSST